ncbi:MAG: hypothetical protein NZ961_19660, partial [Candidatus Poribacteria bacterium]|nr:hypothetical protein [Candidatus Poribacteria bacterium]
LQIEMLSELYIFGVKRWRQGRVFPLGCLPRDIRWVLTKPNRVIQHVLDIHAIDNLYIQPYHG